MGASHLLVRGVDHVVLGVTWRGFATVAEGPPALRAGAGAVLTITFPPQHVAEQTVGDNPPDGFAGSDHLGARLAGTSHVAFAIPEHTEVPLTAEGLLGAIKGAPIIPGAPLDPLNPQTFPAIDEGRPGPTAIELPWRLVMSPEPRTGAGHVQTKHVTDLGAGLAADQAAALWHTVLFATEGGRTGRDRDAGLALRAIDVEIAQVPDPPFTPALGQSRRSQIRGHASTRPAPTQRLELSSLGGALAVRANWGSFGWEHLTSLGRDVRVRTVSSCVLYPFGHQAEYVEVTERIYAPFSPSVMALRQRRTLVITQPVRTQVADPALARAFPFSEVEITQLVFDDIVEPDPFTVARPTPGGLAVAAALSAAEDELAEAEVAAIEAMHGPGVTLDDFAGATIDEVLAFDPIGPDGEQLAPPPALTTWRARREEVEILQQIADGLHAEDVPAFFWPSTSPGVKHQFPVRFGGAAGDVHATMPLLVVFDDHRDQLSILPAFHTLTDPEVRRRLDLEWATSRAGQVPLRGALVDVVGERRRTDVHEVHRLNLVGTAHAGGFAPRLGADVRAASAAAQWSFDVVLPAVRELQRTAAPTMLRYAERFLDVGPAEDIALRVADAARPVVIDFVGRSLGSGGLIAPQIAADAISRAHGLVQAAAFQAATLDPKKLLGESATLLGFRLTDLIKAQGLTVPPAITSALTPGAPPEVKMEWKDVALDTRKPFVSNGATLTMTVLSNWPDTTTTCRVKNFALHLPPFGPGMLELAFAEVELTQRPGQEPVLKITGPSATFIGLLAFVKELQDKVKLGPVGPKIDLRTSGISARYELPIPSVAVGAFALRNIAFGFAVEVPFDGRPVTVTLAFATRANPFNLSVLMFGGGGYLELSVDNDGLQRLEASLEFGASVAVSFVIATAEVHAMGGVRYLMEGGVVHLSGFLRIGGSVELLGLISVSVELQLTLTYDSGRNRMVGRATLVVEIDLTFYSDSVELDSGEWEFIGGDDPARDFSADSRLVGGARRRVFDEPPVETWQRYREAFAGTSA